MLIRILTGAVGIPLLLAAIFLTPGWGFAIVLAAACFIIQIELLWNTGLVKNRFIIGAAGVFAAGIPLWMWFGADLTVLAAAVAVLTLVIFAVAMMGTVRFDCIVNVYFSALVVPLMLSAFVAIQKSENGVYLVLFPFAAAWMSDTGGLFCGKLFGKRLLCPEISPKKTVEGSIGGVAFAALASGIYCAVLKFICGVEPSWAAICILGVVCSFIAQLGDLMFSFIKRERGIKDYGKIIPGHGGFMDRCDSILLVAPVVWAVMSWIPLVRV